MQVTLNIPDEMVSRVVSAVCGRYEYQETVPDPNNEGAEIPNPMTKAQFVKKVILRRLKHDVREWESAAAKTAADAKADSEIQLGG